MEKQYLKTMTDFVLQLDQDKLPEDVMQEVWDYATFLKQPLQLGFFVPCDENGNVLESVEKPNKKDYWSDNNTVFSAELYNYNCDKFKVYTKAKERVLFKDFIYIGIWGGFWEVRHTKTGEHIMIRQDKTSSVERLIIKSRENTFELTESAIKQIGL